MSYTAGNYLDDLTRTAEVYHFPVPYDGVRRHVDELDLPDGGVMECRLPLDLISRESVNLRPDDIEELAHTEFSASADDRDEKQPNRSVQLGFIESEGQIRVISGFEVVEAARLAGQADLRVSLERLSRQDLVDKRLVAGHVNKYLGLDDLIRWTEEAWSFSPWADRLSALQAATLTRFWRPGKSVAQEAATDNVVEWFAAKCQRWEVTPITVFDKLHAASDTDPSVVSQVRWAKGPSKPGRLNLTHLKLLAKHLPGRYDIQRLAAEAIVARSLRQVKAETLASSLASCSNISEAMELLANIDSEAVTPPGEPDASPDEAKSAYEAFLQAQKRRPPRERAAPPDYSRNSIRPAVEAYLRGEADLPAIKSRADIREVNRALSTDESGTAERREELQELAQEILESIVSEKAAERRRRRL